MSIKEAAHAVMKKAVQVAPDKWMPGATPDPLIRQKHGLIGTPVSRLDGPQKVSGTARFAAEFPLERMVYAALNYSTIAKGRIRELHTAEAAAAPGVVLVMTHLNAPRMTRVPLFGSNAKAAGGDDLPIMQDERIHWNGEPIAVVLAESQEQADYAKSLIRVAYEAEPSVTTFEVAKASSEQGVFQGEPLLLEIGDAEAALAAAPHKVDVVYRTPRHNHNPIELHGATVAWDGDELIVHDASQCVTHTAWSLAQVFDIEEEQVHVTSPYVGGGFGSKTLWQYQVLAAAASRLAGRPVRIVLSREGVYRIVGGRTLTEQRVAIGAQADGRFDALIQTGVVGMGRHNNMPEPFMLPAKSAYKSGTFRLQVEAARMDMVGNTFMRAPGEAVGTFALESALDELAVNLGMDPIELRIRNEPDKDPTSGVPFSSRHIVEAYVAGAERFGWNQRNPKPGARREGEWLVGLGCATATYPYYRMPGGVARITLTNRGRATVSIAAHEMGMGTATTQTMVTADRLGLALQCVTVEYGDSHLPGVVLAGGSQQTASIGAAVTAAHDALITELLKLAGKESVLSGLDSEDVIGRDGYLCDIHKPDRRESYVSLMARIGREQITVEGTAPPPLEFTHWSMHSHGAMFCEARVSGVTGETRVTRFLGSFDCGRILNPKTAASQFRGGIVMGLGLALMEETQFDERKGRIMNPSLAEYHVPVQMDVPEIDLIWTDIPDPHAPMGAHGVGEIGITGVGAAVANAVYNATGTRVRDLPITLDKML
ncbi:xanthine dehydrogenase family protein molybdopterin-binding subunit [Granulicella sp. L46]|uniref:xanthine dehydrogenase family protein molybdopterin-binding subunit n=1 Tax=Granulicella sp. L46 TaxID=1641865 RepID=UPI00131EB3DA|nr:xanthine dehydrogenase family protein molybdopterin-binding subunit [Granulicella sp. L46]